MWAYRSSVATKTLKLHDAGNLDALSNLAFVHYTRSQLKEAEVLYLDAASEGHLDAMNALGVLYHKMQRYDDAEYWYTQAVINCHPEAAGNLDALYLDPEAGFVPNLIGPGPDGG